MKLINKQIRKKPSRESPSAVGNRNGGAIRFSLYYIVGPYRVLICGFVNMLNGLIAFQTREKLNIPWKRVDEITKKKK
jgi:hypothetical protein